MKAVGEVAGVGAHAIEFEARRLAWFAAQGFEGQDAGSKVAWARPASSPAAIIVRFERCRPAGVAFEPRCVPYPSTNLVGV